MRGRTGPGHVLAAAGTAAALAVTAAAPVGARELAIGGAGVGDPVFPNLGNGGYDVADYLLDLRYDAASKLVDGVTTIRARTTQSLDRFNLDAAGLDVAAVTVAAVPATFALEGEELVVTPAARLGKGRNFTVVVTYRVDPRRIPPPAGGFVATADGFATAPQPAGAHTVFPGNDHPSDKARFTVRVTAPPGLLGVASGGLVAQDRRADGSTTSTYRTRDPMSTQLLQVSVGRYLVVDRGDHGGTRLRDVVPTLRAATSLPALNLTPGQLEWIEARLGPIPQEAYGILVADTDDPKAFDFTGLETQTLTVYKPAYLLQAEDKIGSHMMHELAHSWFGNSVGPADWSALWLNEGHADLYGLMYRYERGWPDAAGNTTLEARMRTTYAKGDIWRAEAGPVARPTAQTLFHAQRYAGGVLVLYALRQRVGAAAFDAIERAFLARYRHGVASTEDFIDTATEVSGDAGVRAFLMGWLYGAITPAMPGHPDWTLEPVPPTPPPAPPAPYVVGD